MTNNVSLSLGKILNDLDRSFNIDRVKDLWPTHQSSSFHDYVENDDGYSFEIHVPSYNKKNIAIKCDKNILTITSNKKGEEGRELQRFRISDKVDKQKISAKIVDGVLTLNLPKRLEEKGVEIKVE